MPSAFGLEIERYPTPNSLPGRAGERARAVVVHTTHGSFAGTAAWFADRSSGVSSHYLVGLDGRVAQFVDEQDTARHAGRVLRPSAAFAAGRDDLNPVTVGIELEDDGDPEGVARTGAQYAAAARIVAAVCERWGIPLDREHLIGHREAFAAKACPGNVDVDRLLAMAAAVAEAERLPPPDLLCLLPVRNGETDLPGWLDSIAALGGRAAVLDDGSDDRTAEVLDASPAVVSVLANPRRRSYTGWDDGANRRRLLDRAAELGPEWILFLDVDERIDVGDALALRRFLAGDAIPGLAYGLQLHRDWDGRVDPEPRYVYRLFARAERMTLPEGRLHFNPVPIEIERGAWVRTSIRIRHLESAERLARRRSKYAESDPGDAHRVYTDALLGQAPDELVAWPPRPAAIPVLGGPKAPPAGATKAPGERPTLVCLLPVRNGASELEGYLESAARFADAVVALDDGSTDQTAALLEAAPLVRAVLRNPVRPGYAGWDDAANRQRLLDACEELDPRWVIFVDADERIDPDDARALRELAERDAVPGEAYGFRVHRMIGDLARYDRSGLWVYRMFAFEPGLRLPDDRRLHLVPVPTSVPRERRRRTTVRLQHVAGLDLARRRRRLGKYEQADPDRVWQPDYEGAILATAPPRPWVPRPPGLPALPAGRRSRPLSDDDYDLDAPALSAIVIAHEDEATIERTVRSVVEQECERPFEVIVVVSGTDATAAVVRERFARVTVIDLGERALPGRARNAGLRAARGEYVSFPGSHVELPPGSLDARLRAHEAGWPMITGSVVNGTATRSGWASYFLDHSGSLPGRPSGELSGAPAHCSYVRQFVLEAGGFPENMRAGEDTVMNQALWRRGKRAYRSQAIRLTHRSPCTGPLALVRHHFVRGRALARIMRASDEPDRRRIPAGFLRGYARRRLTTTDERVAKWGAELLDEYRRARPLVLLGIASAYSGTVFELARRPVAGSARRGRGEQLRDGDQPHAAIAKAADQRRHGGAGGGAVGAVVEHDDRARMRPGVDPVDDQLRVANLPVARVDVPADGPHPGEPHG